MIVSTFLSHHARNQAYHTKVLCSPPELGCPADLSFDGAPGVAGALPPAVSAPPWSPPRWGRAIAMAAEETMSARDSFIVVVV